MSVSVKATLTVTYRNEYTTNTAGTAVEKYTPTATEIVLDPGSGAGQANKGFTRSGTLTATSTTIDLYSIANTFETLTNTKLKLIIIFNLATTDGAFLTVGNAASNPWFAAFGGSTHTVKVGPGMPLILGSTTVQSSSPLTIDATNRNLKLDSGSATIPYRIIFAGV